MDPPTVPSIEPDALDPFDAATRRRLLAGLVAAWVVFWVLMAWVNLQGHLRDGGREPWRPVLEEMTSALLATAVMWLQWRHGRTLDVLLQRPVRWFAHALAWLPLFAPAFVFGVYGLRHALFGAMGRAYEHAPWPMLLRYELPRFAIFYALFSAVQFGARSYKAWLAERLRAERLASLTQQARLTQLTQQLQPHFLFNALNTISALIHPEPDRADALLGRLAALLRAATDAAQKPEQSLADELALVRGYADIMLERFGDRARIEWEVDEAALECRVPTLALQVLLENAFKHMVERRRALTEISVQVRAAAGVLHLVVAHDGQLAAEPPVFGVGLGNLQQRLAHLHGAAAGVLLGRRDERGGVHAELWLPCAC